MSWSVEAARKGSARATRPVTVVCQMCEAEFITTWNMRLRSPVCPACKPEWQRLRGIERRREKRDELGLAKGRYGEREDFFRVAVDPDGGWTERSRLSLKEIGLLLGRKYLAEGTVFEDTRDGSRLKVEGCKLEPQIDTDEHR